MLKSLTDHYVLKIIAVILIALVFLPFFTVTSHTLTLSEDGTEVIDTTVDYPVTGIQSFTNEVLEPIGSVDYDYDGLDHGTPLTDPIMFAVLFFVFPLAMLAVLFLIKKKRTVYLTTAILALAHLIWTVIYMNMISGRFTTQVGLKSEEFTLAFSYYFMALVALSVVLLAVSLHLLCKTFVYMSRYEALYLLLLLPIIYFVVFRYVPFVYVQIAFKQYSIVQSVWTMPWAGNYGFEYFIKAFENRDFLYAIRNTLMLNLLDLGVGFPAPIILAIILNELPFKKFKRFTQTVAYMPHFLSWIIIFGLSMQLFSPTTGLVNILITKTGREAILFLNEPVLWVVTYVLLGIWQSIGWNTIIYLAAITNINPELYEAASVDGASRMRKIWHITLPGIRPTIMTLLILALGGVMGGGMDRPYALRNPLVNSVSNTISIFVYNAGIRGLQFSLTTAVGLFQSVIGVIFLLTANTIAKRLGERGIW